MDNIENKDTEHGSYSYGYDALYRLTTTDNPVQDDEAFTYDGVGNRLTAADTTGDWTYNQNNELDGYDDVAYEYDANGNMVQKTIAGVVTKFFYNLEDRLERVEDGFGSVVASYHYDPFGRRLWKEVSGVRTYFHYADEGLVVELDPSGNVTKSYGYKPGSTWTTDPLFMKQGTDYYFYQNDHLGTPQKLTAINGAVVWAAKYSSFGKATVGGSSTITNNLRFAGQYFDQETGLHYNYFRYYDPAIGRYLRTDPIGIAGGINLWTYAQSNPIIFSDPFGLKCNKCPGGEWEGSSFFGLSAFWGGGVTIDRVFWSCKASGATCEAVYFCFGGGVIGEASIDFFGKAKASNAYNSRDLIGWSTGWRGSFPIGKASLSGTKTKGLHNEAVIEHGSGGIGEGGGIAKITCTTLSTTCE